MDSYSHSENSQYEYNTNLEKRGKSSVKNSLSNLKFAINIRENKNLQSTKFQLPAVICGVNNNLYRVNDNNEQYTVDINDDVEENILTILPFLYKNSLKLSPFNKLK
ncbi:hypothetical protein cand_016140 [Cryptosporidium andersoni]|uniref:Uncharacterized protein n=1 Tax=Cryptosporidium andersoni TaxID=117008 RepID=A0A1J4MU59_9CRYT|nr:hypothetical protein cand_016140 [Cryptosporidium andersoni]